MIAAIIAAVQVASSPSLGLDAGRCRSPEQGPAIMVAVEGLKDRRGRLRLELYPADDADFLADDNLLINAGKTFTRVDIETPASSPVELCIRAPHPGRFSLSFLHDRDGDHRFELSSDGIGFAGNPPLGWSKPHAAAASVDVGTGITRIGIVPNYLHGLGLKPEHGR